MSHMIGGVDVWYECFQNIPIYTPQLADARRDVGRFCKEEPSDSCRCFLMYKAKWFFSAHTGTGSRAVFYRSRFAEASR